MGFDLGMELRPVDDDDDDDVLLLFVVVRRLGLIMTKRGGGCLAWALMLRERW